MKKEDDAKKDGQDAQNEVCVDLKKTVLEFITDVKDVIIQDAKERIEFSKVLIYFRAITPTKIMEHASKHITPHIAKIKKRDVAFFLNNKHIFAGLPNDRIQYYSKKFETGGISDQNMKIIWEYWDTISSLMEEHKKIK